METIQWSVNGTLYLLPAETLTHTVDPRAAFHCAVLKLPMGDFFLKVI